MKRRSKGIFGRLFLAVGVLTIFSMIAIAPTTYGQVLPWEQVQIDGFGDPDNKIIISSAEFLGHLYVGTDNWATGGEVWRTTGGATPTWERVGIGGFGNRDNTGITSLTVLGGHLYAGTDNLATGGEVWRSSDGTTWTPVVGPAPATILGGFGNPDNRSIASLIVFGVNLYAGTENSMMGAEVWRTAGGATPIWTRVDGGVFVAANEIISSMAVFVDGYLYAGTENWFTGGEVWRSSDGTIWTPVVGPAPATIGGGFGNLNNVMISYLTVFTTGGVTHLYAGTCNIEAFTGISTGGEIWRTTGGATPIWTRVDGGAFGADNAGINTMAVFGTHLYAGTFNNPLPPAVITGGEVWRSLDGTTWTPVVGPSPATIGGGFGNLNNETIFSMAVFGGHLYAGTENHITGAEVWRSSDGTTWIQVGFGGFGAINNEFIIPPVVFGAHLYAGTSNPTGGEIWRSSDGITWTQVELDGFGDTNNVATIPTVVFGGHLYAGTANEVTGGEIWRSPDGITWTQVATGGFVSVNNTSVFPWAVFGGNLYVGTFNEMTGGEVWRSPTGGPGTWTQVGFGGFGNPQNVDIFPIVVFDGHLYAGTSNWTTGGEVWRSPTGHFGTWTQVNADGFGDANNEQVAPWAVFGSHLYVGTRNNPPFPAPSTGGEIWRTAGGATPTWERVDGNAFGAANDEITTMAVFTTGGITHLYAGTGNWTTGGEVWRSQTGAIGSWTQVNLDGFGDVNNTSVFPWAVFGGRLYAGTSNRTTGGEVWRTDGIMAPTIGHSPSSFSFTAVEGGANPATQTLNITNTGGGTLNWSVSEEVIWLTLAPASGSSTGETDPVTVSVSITGLTAATYSTTIAIRATGATNTPQTVPITLTVNPATAPTIGHSPSSFSFTAVEGGANPATQTLNITNTGGGTLNWSIMKEVTWLTLAPASGSSTGETDSVTVSVSITGLAAATYSTTITIRATGATNTPQTVPITLTIAPAPPVPPAPPTPAPDGGCFIATAVFGTPMAEEVESLSRFRDQYMVTNELGRRFVSLYYRHSPAMAEYISDREWAKRIVRIALSPLVRIAEFIVGREKRRNS